ncbi:MAG: ribosome maturation factor RimP [Pseudomonadota bacterium]
MSETGSDLDPRPLAREDGIAAQVAELITEPLVGLGFRLVRVQVTGGDSQTLQIMAERPDGTMTITDCEMVSKQLSPLLDAYDPISGSYRLEVSSPGIDRPLVRADDFEAWSGFTAKVTLRRMLEGRRKFRGIVDGYEDDEVRLEVDLGDQGRQVIGLPVDMVEEARLVLTDDLIRESLRRAKAAGAEVGDGSPSPDNIDIKTGSGSPSNGTKH